MSEDDYSVMRSIADEPHWREFAQSVGGELIAPLIKREGVLNADFLFRGARVVAELKILQTEFAHSKEMLTKVDSLTEKYPGVDPDDPSQPLGRALFAELRKPLQRIINKASRQIKQTKTELGLHDYRGLLICVNGEFRGAPPGLVQSLLSHVLAGVSYKSITATIYQTNHYIELPELPYAALLWAPMYAPEADDTLVEFVNDLGRKWRAFAEKIDGPYDASEEMETLRLGEATVVSGVRRNRRFEG